MMLSIMTYVLWIVDLELGTLDSGREQAATLP